MISSQLSQNVTALDNVIHSSDIDFGQSGLLQTSIVRVTRIAVVEQSIFLGKIGSISSQRLERIKTQLSSWIQE